MKYNEIKMKCNNEISWNIMKFNEIWWNIMKLNEIKWNVTMKFNEI